MYTTLVFSVLFVSGLSILVAKNRKKSKQMVEKINGGAQLLDVRTREEFESGALNKAMNVPLNEWKEEIGKLNPDQYYITYCSHGVRSVKAMQVLKKNGIEHVENGGSMKQLQRKINRATI